MSPPPSIQSNLSLQLIDFITDSKCSVLFFPVDDVFLSDLVTSWTQEPCVKLPYECLSVWTWLRSDSVNAGRPPAAGGVCVCLCDFSYPPLHILILPLTPSLFCILTSPLTFAGCVCVFVSFLSTKERKFVCGFWSPQLLKLQQIHLPLFHVKHVRHWICD